MSCPIESVIVLKRGVLNDTIIASNLLEKNIIMEPSYRFKYGYELFYCENKFSKAYIGCVVIYADTITFFLYNLEHISMILDYIEKFRVVDKKCKLHKLELMCDLKDYVEKQLQLYTFFFNKNYMKNATLSDSIKYSKDKTLVINCLKDLHKLIVQTTNPTRKTFQKLKSVIKYIGECL